MKTIRTILGTLAVIVLGYGLLAVISFRGNSAFLQRTLYQIFAQSYFVALVLGVAFLLIAIILTVALMSFRDDEREEREEDALLLSSDLSDDDELDEDEADKPVRAELGSFRRPTRASAPRIELEDMQDDTFEEEEDVPAFLKKGASVRTRAKTKLDADVPSVESIFDDQDDEPAPPVKKRDAKRCVFCNAVVEDDSKTCPSCGKRL